MATGVYESNPNAWVKVAQGAALVELRRNCKRLYVTTSQIQPSPTEEAYHVLTELECRTFSYGGAHGVYIKSDPNDEVFKVVVTSDNLAQ